LPTLADLLAPEQVAWLAATTKDDALRELLLLISHSAAVRDPGALHSAILSREVLMSTGIGYGVAVPHAHIPTVESFVLALGISTDGIPYNGVVDDDPVRLIVMIAGPDRERAGYLKLLSTLMKFIKSEKGKILSSSTAEEVVRLARHYSYEPADH
jgi:mannitol/fructose-specific phosphotransferase system IIA component (Ntr-type)